ncbi:MAG: CPBP family intramembrane metalloprotease [Acidobacteriia bacterium]|nr:CPBP family intramembrane metalloprotease [Terriglobia bacterium]
MATDALEPSRPTPDRPLVAPLRHTLIFLLIQVGLAAGGAYMQHRPGTGPSATPEHPAMAPVYVFMIVLEWALVYYVWVGLHQQKRIGILELAGGRWKSWKDVWLDLVIAAPFWFVWEEAAQLMHNVLGASHAKPIDALLPQGALEIMLWCVLSVSAGVCEEIVFRGYFQKQFQALTGSIVLAVLAQAVVFGIGHAYQGTKQVVVITGLGVLYGVLAAWRKNLRPGMIAHAWSDVYGGWMFKLLTK